MYKLPTLQYLYQDLEPFIDTHTIGIHYHKHHQNYLNKLNELLVDNNYDYKYNLYELIFHIDEFPEEDILFNLGGVLNHNLYFKSMNNNKRQKPEGSLKELLNNQYGSYEKFWKKLKKKVLKLKGSGYIFLVLKSSGELDIVNTSNQETPLSFGCIPLFVVDMWEHAYYLNYENDKSKYLDNFELIADFTYANKLYNNLGIKN